jgi:uncharacterized protein YkwD
VNSGSIQVRSTPVAGSQYESELLQEINLVRTKPSEFATILEQAKAHFKGNIYQPPGQPALSTQEGAKALDEAVAFLRRASPLRPYSLSPGMTQAAKHHVIDQGARGLTGHRGADGSLCEQRLGRFGSLQGSVGENLSYSRESTRQRIITWLVDDGFASRGHRLALLSPDFKVVGVSCGDHSSQGVMCVVTFAGGFTEKSAAGGARSF